jgi:hypothetical protein
MGDCHLRGCAAKILASLDTRFDVCGVVKPGLNNESLMEKAKGEVRKLTMNDFLIIWSGTNDMERNHPQNAFKNITNSVQSVNRTSIILISVPYRHDIMNHSHITVRLKPLIANYSNLQTFSTMSI